MKLEEFKTKESKIIDKFVLDQRRNETPRLKAYFRASEITECPRCMLFSMLNLPQDLYPRAKSDTARGYKLMRKGTAIHEIVQEYLEGIGILLPEDKEKVIKDEECLFSGHCDGVLTFEDRKVLLEIKSINPDGFKTITQPKEGHFYQGQAYAHFLKKQFGYDLDDILFLYVDRGSDNLDMKAFWVMKDENVVNMIINKLKVLKGYFEREELCPIPPGLQQDAYPHKWSPYNTDQMCKSNKLKFSDFPGAVIVKNNMTKHF